MISFDPCENSMKRVLTHFTDKETGAQGVLSKVTHSAEVQAKSPDINSYPFSIGFR